MNLLQVTKKGDVERGAYRPLQYSSFKLWLQKRVVVVTFTPTNT